MIRSTGEHHWIVIRRVAASMAIALAASMVTYNSFRINAVSRLSQQVVILQDEVKQQDRINAQRIEDLSARLDEIERILFGEVLAKLEKVPKTPSGIALWQKTRDQELRERISRLERWRLEHEIKP